MAGKLFDKQEAVNVQEAKTIAANLKEVQNRIEKLEERYFIASEMSRETYERLLKKYTGEKQEIEAQLKNAGTSSSNLKKPLEHAVSISPNLAPLWVSSEVRQKESLQKLVFPRGIIYDRQKQSVRTTEVNAVFELMSSVTQLPRQDKNKQGTQLSALSSLVGTTRLTPT